MSENCRGDFLTHTVDEIHVISYVTANWAHNSSPADIVWVGMTTVLCSCLRLYDVLGEGKLWQDALVCTEGQEVDLRFSRFNTTGNGFHLQPCTNSFSTNI